MAKTGKIDDLGEVWMVDEHYNVLSEAVKQYDASSVLVEIGTKFGRSAIHMLKSNPNIKLTCVDIWSEKKVYQGFLDNIKRYKVEDRITVVKEYSEKIDFKEVDFIYLDADHSEEAVYSDIKHCMKMLKRGGILIGDDLQMPQVERALQRCINEKVCVLLNKGEFTYKLTPTQITLFCPLAGRFRCWKKMEKALRNLQWPHKDVFLLICNTSKNKKFAHIVKKSLETMDYPYRYYERIQPIDGLADLKRNIDVARQVFFFLSKTYNEMTKMIETPYLWLVDDDTIPPTDALNKLMTGFSKSVFSVSGAYRLNPRRRYSPGFCAWNNPRTIFLEGPSKGSQIEIIGGNGFGCALLKHNKDFTFGYNADFNGGFDEQFYLREAKKGRKAAIHWDVIAEHMDGLEKEEIKMM